MITKRKSKTKKPTRKERDALSKIIDARNDFFSVINDANNEYGTGFTVDDALKYT